MTRKQFGGSDAARTLQCPAWHAASAGIPRTSSAAAERGTACHQVMATLIDRWGTVEPAVFADQPLVDIDAIEVAWEHTQALLREHLTDGWVIPELPVGTGDTGGTADLVAASEDGSTVVLGDFKFGYHPVPAENNVQLLHYAACLDRTPGYEGLVTNAKRLLLVVIQDGVDIWEAKPSDVMLYWTRFVHARTEALQGESEPTPGPECRFCPAMVTCPAQRELRRRIKDPIDLDEAMRDLPHIEAWCTAVRKAALEHLEAGNHITGWKLVDRRSYRSWRDGAERAVKECLPSDHIHLAFTQPALKSPNQMEQLFKKLKLTADLLQDYIEPGRVVGHNLAIDEERNNERFG